MKLFQLPKISTALVELAGFTYATALDLNMGYYAIYLDLIHQAFAPLLFLGANALNLNSNCQWALQLLKTSSKQECQR